ncbi:MAG: flagellar hook-length control protein FliK [Chloroflexota bacterium]
MMNLLPPAPAASGASPDGSQGKGSGVFHGMLGALSALLPEAVAKAGAPADGGRQPSTADPASGLMARLQAMLESLAGESPDMRAPGLGLTARQLDVLLSKLEKVLKAGKGDGHQLLASLLGGSQVAPASIPPNLAGLVTLLGTGADGSISSGSVEANLRLLDHALQLVHQSGGQLTLKDAVESLAPRDDVFARRLERLLASPEPNSTGNVADVAADGPAQAPPDSLAVTEPPPKPVDPGPGTEPLAGDSVAGSNGHTMTPANTAGSPADGATTNGSQGQREATSSLARALEALVSGQRPSSPVASGQPIIGTGAGAEPAVAPARDGVSLPPPTAQEPSAAPPAPPAPGHEQGSQTGGKPAAAVSLADLERARLPIASPDGGAGAESASARQFGNGAAAGRPAVEKPAGGHEPLPVQPLAPASAPPMTSGVLGGALSAAVTPANTSPQPASLPVGLAAQPAPLPVNEAVVEQIVQQATVSLNAGHAEFRVQLKPEFLGAMEVRVSVTDGVALVRMAAENPDTRQLVEANLGQLRQAFGTGEVRVEYVPSFNHWDASSTFGRQGAQQGFWQGSNPYQSSSPLQAAIPFQGEADAPAEGQPGSPAPASAGALPTSKRSAIDLQA